MNHAPVHTTGEPVSPEAARELAELDRLIAAATGPLLIGAGLADLLIARFGGLPANTEVYVTLGEHARDMPTAGDLVARYGRQIGKTARVSEHISDAFLMLPPKACDELADDPLPAIRAQRIKPLRGATFAQWKRERNGRR